MGWSGRRARRLPLRRVAHPVVALYGAGDRAARQRGTKGTITMASETGTAGNDTLDHFGEAGPGTLIGLAGDDCIFTGSGAWTVTGDSGQDTIALRTGNTGSVVGGTENDSVWSANPVGAVSIFGNAGADSIYLILSTGNLTIAGGDDSSDGADSIGTGSGADLIFGNGGADTILSQSGADTMVGGFGNDSFFEVAVTNGNQQVFGNEGNDSVFVSAGNDTVVGGQGNDSIYQGAGGGSSMWFGNEGNDTINGATATVVTIVGGVDSADGADSLLGSNTGADLVFGNGG